MQVYRMNVHCRFNILVSFSEAGLGPGDGYVFYRFKYPHGMGTSRKKKNTSFPWCSIYNKCSDDSTINAISKINKIVVLCTK